MNLTKYARATIWIYFGTPGAATHVQKSSTDRGIDFGKSWGPNWSRKKLKKQYPGTMWNHFGFPGAFTNVKNQLPILIFYFGQSRRPN